MSRLPSARCLPLSEWPDLDRHLWEQAVDDTDPFSDSGGIRSKQRPITNRNVARGYGRWLTFLLSSSAAGVLAGHPADRITREAVLRYIGDLEEHGNLDSTIMARLAELREAAKVMDPDRDWSFLPRLVARIRGRRRHSPPKTPLLNTSAELVDLGLDLMRQAEALGFTRRAAVLYRDGLIIALLALRPLRLRNLTELTLDEHLVRVGAGWGIIIPAASTKTHVLLEYDWPEELEEPLARYLAVYRPLLAARNGRWHREVGQRLWVSTDGSPLVDAEIYIRICEHTRRRFGRAINPHQFRHIAATTMAIYFPANVREASPLLGHSNPHTSEAYYVKASGLQACRAFTSHIAAIRKTHTKKQNRSKRS